MNIDEKGEAMRKKTFIAFSLFFLSVSLFAAEKPIGRVEKVLGKAIARTFDGKKILRLEKGMPVLEGMFIITEENSRVLIQFSNGLLKWIPENSKSGLLNESYMNRYEKTLRGVEKLTEIVGLRATEEEKEVWKDDIKKAKENIRDAFRAKNYLKVLEVFEDENIRPDTPELMYIRGSSLLKMGNENRAEPLFQELIRLKAYPYEEKARFALFMVYWRKGYFNKALEIRDYFREKLPKSPYLGMIDEILEVAVQ
jgi:tetratricopeptide (TPR) repeat protein